MRDRLVIVGGGQAAIQTVQTVRQLGFAGPVTLVGDEPDPPYQRPPLSKKYLAGAVSRERLWFKPREYYDRHEVELRLGARAAAIDTAHATVALADGSTLAYDRLVLATGGRARRLQLPGADLDGIHYLRTIADVDAIAARLAAGRRLVIVGAGYIGLEVAAVARTLGLDVTVLEAAGRVLARVVCAEVAEYFDMRHRAAGVDIRCNSAVTGFAGSGRVAAVETADGARHACDLVVVGIGIEPNVELAAAAGLECDDGIRVDECTRTADERVLAAGDCTRHAHALVEGEVRLESVHNAVEQGRSAAHAVVGQPRPFSDVPWFWSDQYDVKLQIAGVAPAWDTVVVRGAVAEGHFAAYYLDAGRLAAVDAVNSPRDFMTAKKLIAARAAPTAEEIADPAFDLASAVP